MIKLIKLTSPNGDTVYVNPEQICTIAKSVDNERAKTIIHHESGIQYVREELEQVVKLLQ